MLGTLLGSRDRYKGKAGKERSVDGIWTCGLGGHTYVMGAGLLAVWRLWGGSKKGLL